METCMKILQSSLVRAICAVIVGVLLVRYRELTVKWITIATGILFFLSGIASCAAYFVARRHDDEPLVYAADGRQISCLRPQFPIVGLGSVILGLILALMPGTFTASLMYILAAVLILGALGQFVTLASAVRLARIGIFYWIMPSIMLLVGLLAIVYPKAIASAPLLVIGWCLIVYGVVECINSLKVHSLRKAIRQQAKMAELSTEDEDGGVQ